MKQPQDTKASHANDRRPEYVIVVAELAGQTRSSRASLTDALTVRATMPREPEAGPGGGPAAAAGKRNLACTR